MEVDEKPLTYQRLRIFSINDNSRTPRNAESWHSGSCAKDPGIAEQGESFVHSEERPNAELRGGATSAKEAYRRVQTESSDIDLSHPNRHNRRPNELGEEFERSHRLAATIQNLVGRTLRSRKGVAI
jgi:hypothetical protein